MRARRIIEAPESTDRIGPHSAPISEDPLAGLEDALSLGAAALSAEACLLGLANPRDGWIRTVLGAAPDQARQRAALCTFAMMQDDTCVLRDVREVASLARLPGLTGGGRGFIGAPVLGPNGSKVGGLAVLLDEGRAPSDRDLSCFAALRRQVGRLVAHQRRVEELAAERQQASGALAMLRGLLRASTTVAILGTDLGGRIHVFSEGAERMFRMSAREAVGRTATALLAGPPAVAPDALHGPPSFTQIVADVEPDSPRERPFLLQCADGTCFEGSITAALVADSQDGATGYALIVRDITEQRASEQMKDDFVSMVSHELRTPLTAIRGGLGLLIGEVVGPLSEPIRELVDIAHASSERLLRVVGDILDVQALASGRLELDVCETDLLDCVARATTLVKPVCDARGVTATLRRTTSRTTVEADPGRVVQVLVNLLSNAAKHSPEGGLVHIDVDGTSTGVMVSVEDEGPGVPESARERLFRKFSRLTRDPGGTGLGLAIVKAIVQLHGGEVSYRPASPSGSIFAFTLPFAHTLSRPRDTVRPASTMRPRADPIYFTEAPPKSRAPTSG
ncbi:MAG: PAS domain-containing sensor histidine kinase [Polyangiaceae bacterium]